MLFYTRVFVLKILNSHFEAIDACVAEDMGSYTWHIFFFLLHLAPLRIFIFTRLSRMFPSFASEVFMDCFELGPQISTRLMINWIEW